MKTRLLNTNKPLIKFLVMLFAYVIPLSFILWALRQLYPNLWLPNPNDFLYIGSNIVGLILQMFFIIWVAIIANYDNLTDKRIKQSDSNHKKTLKNDIALSLICSPMEEVSITFLLYFIFIIGIQVLVPGISPIIYILGSSLATAVIFAIEHDGLRLIKESKLDKFLFYIFSGLLLRVAFFSFGLLGSVIIHLTFNLSASFISSVGSSRRLKSLKS